MSRGTTSVGSASTRGLSAGTEPRASALLLGPARSTTEQILSGIKKRRQSGLHLPTSRVGRARAGSMVRHWFHIEGVGTSENFKAVAHYHLGHHPKPTYDDKGFTIHDPAIWARATKETHFLTLWWGHDKACIYEENFTLLDLATIQKHSEYTSRGPLSTDFCTVPARLAYNSREGFDANLFWSVALMMHTLGTTGVKAWDEELQTLLAVPTSEDLPFVAPPPPPILPITTPITTETYHDLQSSKLAKYAAWQAGVHSLHKRVDTLKSAGNTAFRMSEFETAIVHYTEAIDTCDGRNVPVAPLHVLYANRAAARLKIGQHEEAAEDAKCSVELAPLWPKSHYRLACAFREMGQFDKAKESLEYLLTIHPENNMAQQELAELESRIKAAAKK